jgi:hypothetical protein
MNSYYLPFIYKSFKDGTEEIYNSRTANLTLSIGNRIQGFESSIQSDTLKIAKYLQDIYQPNFTFPYQIVKQYHPNCTGNVSLSDQSNMNTLQPLWDNAMNLQIGYNHDINAYRVIVLFNNSGACVWSNDPTDQLLSTL